MKCRNHFVKRDSCSTIPPSPHTISLHPLTRAFHFAPRIKTARRFTAKNP